MRIGINLLPYTPNHQGGAEIYIRNLIYALGDLELEHEFVLFITSNVKDAYLPGKGPFSEVVIPAWITKWRTMRVLVEQLILPWFVFRSHVDCLFSNYVIPALVFVPQVVNVHDMLYKRYPEFIEVSKRLYWSVMIPISLWRSKTILTVSHSSAKDIALYFPWAEGKIKVTVEGVNKDLSEHKDANVERICQELKITLPFILSTATFGPHKNMRTLIEAFAMLADKLEIDLVLTGGAGTGDAVKEQQALKQFVTELGLVERVHFTGYVSEEHLAALYKGAIVYVNPSSFEGFGLSIIEAQHFDTPVICSNIPALSEVGGSSVRLFDSNSSGELAEILSEVLTDQGEREKMIELGKTNVKKYKWDLAANDLVNAVINL
ncbi:MAG: glycosyltransferase family 4 protein [Ardenticatenaceae bacterium]|nr:glycosyltransferase family 4 protein [Ardenticatenaceae bacterium]MCB9005490.1 glycosyltransferase family 4 protein [Ardenticatenaceae bacterium]